MRSFKSEDEELLIAINTMVQMERLNCIRNKGCDLEVFKCLNNISPHAYKNYFVKINHCMSTRSNTNNIVYQKSGLKPFAFQEAQTFNKLSETVNDQNDPNATTTTLSKRHDPNAKNKSMI